MEKALSAVKGASGVRRHFASWSFPTAAFIFFCSSLLAGVAGCTKTTDVFDEFTTDVRPRLENGEPARRGPVINAAAFNAGAIGRTVAPYSGFIGPKRVTYPGDREKIESDLSELGKVVSRGFDPNGTVTIDFRKASLNFILDQLLRGALGVNYLAPDNLPGAFDFRMETPIPKSRVVQVVRDLLSRNGLVMRLVNGVYQIGAPEVIDALSVNSAAGQSGNEVAKVVHLDKDNAAQVAALAAQLIPDGKTVRIIATESPDSIVLRADANDIDSVANMLVTLSKFATGSDQIAIIPLKRSAPEAVATQLNSFYGKSLREEKTTVTVLPLTNQQAILVSTSDAALMRGVQQLAEQLDRSVTDISGLRVIPVVNLRAEDIAPQLAQMFGSTVASQEPLPDEDGPERTRASTGVGSRLVTPRPLVPEDDSEGTGLTVPPPATAFSPGGGESGPSPGDGGGDKGGGPFKASVTAAPQAGETRIVANSRTNSILVYSTYSVYKRMREVVQTLDVPQAQVIIEATVIEVVLNDALESGVQFFLQSNGIVLGSGVPDGNQSPSKGGMIGIGTMVGNVSVDAVMRALRSVTSLKVVSSPYLTVVDGKSARLVIGDQIPFATTTQTSSNQGNVTVTQDVKILDTGVVLQITPRIHANNSVHLDIIQSVSTPSSESKATSLTPTIATRDITSQVLAQSGHTILLGGLMQDRLQRIEDGTPMVSDIPVIGKLFTQSKNEARRTELLVLITPRVVRSSSEIESITRLLQSSPDYKDLKSK